MKEWMKVRTNKALFVLAAVSFAVITIEGFLYYASYPDAFFRFLMILQNTIKAFTFKANISLENARSFMLTDPSPFKTVLGYLYMVCVFTAPYCTIATVYKVLERAFKFAFWLRGSEDDRHIVIFGYNDTVRQLLRSADGKRQRIHVVCDKDPSAEERYRLIRRKVRLHSFDLAKADEKEVDKLLKELEIDKAEYVLLFDDSSIRNFSILQTLGGRNNRLAQGSKVFCRCEDEGIGRLIESYYDTAGDGSNRRFDFEIIDLPELQVRSMYRDAPLHSYWMNGDEESRSKPEDWRVHLLILGFGKVGQQALLQAMNLGVTHSGNPIVIDVIDQEMEKNRALFLNHFSPGAIDPVGGDPDVCTLDTEWADGQLTLRFHKMDVRYGAFRKLLSQLTEKPAGNFTYVVSSIDQADTGIHCISELWRFLRATDRKHGKDVPILARMDSDLRLQRYLKNDAEGSLIEGVRVIRPPEDILTFSNLFGAETDSSAKQCNAYYAKMTFDANGAVGPVTEKEVQASWNALTLFRRNANRAAAYHNTVLRDVLDCSLGEEGKVAVMQPLFEGEDALIRWEDGKWHFTITDDEFIERVSAPENAFACEMLKMEHRRWCYYTASIGWEPPAENGRDVRKDDRLRINPCIVPWDALLRYQPQTCKYDLMPLMAEWEAEVRMQ
jgi:hypothetical protein